MVAPTVSVFYLFWLGWERRFKIHEMLIHIVILSMKGENLVIHHLKNIHSFHYASHLVQNKIKKTNCLLSNKVNRRFRKDKRY